MQRFALGISIVATVLVAATAQVWAHGQPPPLTFYGNFGGNAAICQQAVGQAARTCFNRVLSAERRCMDQQMIGLECDTAARDASIEAAKQRARQQLADRCDDVSLQILQFLSLDEAQRDVVNACEGETAAAISVMFGPVGGGGTVSGPPSSGANCLRQAAREAQKFIRHTLHLRQRTLDSIAKSDLSPSAKNDRMARIATRIAQVRQLIMGRIAAACGGFTEFSSLYGKDIGAFLDLSDTRANCVTAAGYVQGAVTCPPAQCGNGAKEGGEECDDGNAIDDDACHTNCTKTNCSYFPNTYQLIQAAIFESKGCTNEVCHGAARSGALDLRRGASYQNLVDAPSSVSLLKRVNPGDKDHSFLFRKLAAATLGNIPNLEGSPMPNGGLPPLTQNELEAVRLWIYTGAPETGVVKGVADLLDACAPPPDPIQIRPPAPPEPGAGVQMHMPPLPLPPKSETEVCFASYYDFTNVVPKEFQSSYGTFRFKKKVETQDPLSHHLIIHTYLGDYGPNDPGWGAWTCKGGAAAGRSCDPLDPTACGADSVCGSEPQVSVACIGFGPADYSESKAPAWGGSQQPVSDSQWADGVYEELPLKGITVWNSHAFNTTTSPAKVEAWVNFDFAAPLEQQYVVKGGILDPDNKIFIMNVPPFERQRYCYNYTFGRGAHLFEISSHMHKRGKLFQVYAPNHTPDGELIYSSTQYNDPVHLTFSPPIVLDSANAADRTYRYCAEYDNGFTDPTTVKRKSTSPLPPLGVPIGGPCAQPTHCAEGKVGSACHGAGTTARNRSCDTTEGALDGRCDACPLKGGVTTEDEMFLFLATYFCDGSYPVSCPNHY